VYWLPHLREKGIKPTWGVDYEHLFNASIDVDIDVDVEEDGEGDVTWDDYHDEEGNQEIGNEEEVDGEIVLDDDINDLKIDD
jgi:hypothetical protein